MSNYNKWKLTNVGKDYLNKAIANGNVQFALEEIRLSSTKYNYDTIQNLTALSRVKAQSELYGEAVDSKNINVYATVDNKKVTEGFYAETLGIYGTYNGNNFLFAVSTAKTPSYLGKYDGISASSINFAIHFIVDDSKCITINTNIDGTVNIAQYNDLLQRVEDLELYCGMNENTHIYGVELNFYNNTSTRLMGAKGMTAKDFSNLPMYKRTLYQYDPVNKRWTSNASASVTNQITMVKQLKFYYRIDYLDVDDDGYANIVRLYVSDKPYTGFAVHPLFVAYDGREMDYVMLDTMNRLFVSKTDEPFTVPTSQKTLSYEDGAIESHKLGDGWSMTNWESIDAIRLLFAIENGTMNIQEVANNSGSTDMYDTGTKTWKTGTVIPLKYANVNGLNSTVNTETPLKVYSKDYSGYSFKDIVWRGQSNLVGGIRYYIDNFRCIAKPTNFEMYINDKRLTGILPYNSTNARKYYPNAFCKRNDGILMYGKTGGNSDNLIGDVMWLYDGTTYNGKMLIACANGGSTGDVENGLSYLNTRYSDSGSVDTGIRLMYKPLHKDRVYIEPTQYIGEQVKQVKVVSPLWIYDRALEEFEDRYKVRRCETGEILDVIGYKQMGNYMRLQVNKGWISGNIEVVASTYWHKNDVGTNDIVLPKAQINIYKDPNLTTVVNSTTSKLLYEDIVVNSSGVTVFKLHNGAYCTTDKTQVDVTKEVL